VVHLDFLHGLLLPAGAQAQVSFPGTEFIGRPTASSMTVNVVADTAIEAYFEFGTQSGVYTGQSSVVSAAANEPLVAVMNGLLPNTHYFYRTRYRQTGASTWLARDEHSFWTARSAGSTFTFTVTSDSHVNVGGLGNANVYSRTLQNIGNDAPDFDLDLGDTFAMDNVTTQAQAYTSYLFQRPYMGLISHSVPIFLVLGNHEEEEGWHLDDTGNPATSKPVMGANARRRYFLNPYPNSFYFGNSDNSAVFVDGDHLTGDYYAFQWGDALFVAATFPSGAGWQTATFSTPVAITAGTTYIASYHTSQYVWNTSYFSGPLTVGPLTAPQNAGVYAYGSGNVFPSSTWQSSNYWVDVLFAPAP
jgi:hypothetical protein